MKGFFTRKENTRAPRQETDPIILAVGQITDEAILGSLVEEAAFWAAHNRKRTGDLDREYPGYREELNRRRAAVGLPPI